MGEGERDLAGGEILGHQRGEFRVVIDQKDGELLHGLLV
jgi:hypothetical protein